MELQSKITNAGVIYLPSEIRQSFGRQVKLLPDSCAAILYGADTPLVDVVDSVKVLLQDLDLRIRRSKRDEGVGK
ncbi:hypothetical protein AUI46_04265 [archaeon 13_1_40CM_2_52_13]|nr:MAG: hypothetical protein AUI46_04265 [archaeon 13_1_40CM_2_52_13]OLE69359.1 MAG: hypothetical protein AUF78_11430 [archaeon 13_1_20CM_2_51_12]